MGGHAAWRKRVASGETAKGSGGAILRHRPRLGRRGKDLALNRKGNIAGGNPKKKKKSRTHNQKENRVLEESTTEKEDFSVWALLPFAAVVCFLVVRGIIVLGRHGKN